MTEPDQDLETAAKLKRWSKSGLIEEAVVRDHSVFQTEEFDRNSKGELLIEELVRREDVAEKIISSIRASLKFRDRYEKGSQRWREHQEAVFEKLSILRWIVGKDYQDIESEEPREYLKELRDKITGKGGKQDG